MLYTNEQVKKFLPHREPFLFINSVDSVEHDDPNFQRQGAKVRDLVGTRVHAKYYTKPDHPIFSGHFPNYPILPGVIQIEMMAQAAGFLVHFLYDDITKINVDVALLSVAFSKFRKPIFPDMDLDIYTVCSRARGVMINSQCKIEHKGDLMSEAEVMASLRT